MSNNEINKKSPGLDDRITELCDSLFDKADQIDDTELRLSIEADLRSILKVSIEVGELEKQISKSK